MHAAASLRSWFRVQGQRCMQVQGCRLLGFTFRHFAHVEKWLQKINKEECNVIYYTRLINVNVYVQPQHAPLFRWSDGKYHQKCANVQAAQWALGAEAAHFGILHIIWKKWRQHNNPGSGYVIYVFVTCANVQPKAYTPLRVRFVLVWFVLFFPTGFLVCFPTRQNPTSGLSNLCPSAICTLVCLIDLCVGSIWYCVSP